MNNAATLNGILANHEHNIHETSHGNYALGVP